VQVIFIKNLKGQGLINEVKEVKDGYATNFLIKKGYAIKATKTNLDKLNKSLNQANAEEERLIKELEATKKSLEKQTLTLKVKTGESGKLFGSISNKQISDELKELGFKIDKKQISVEHITLIGDYIINIDLTKGIKAKVKLKVVNK